MKVKKEMPTGSVTGSSGTARASRCVQDVVDVEREEAVVLEPSEEDRAARQR